LGLGREGLLSDLADWLGIKDIQVGDAAFDEAFEIRGDEPARVLALLTPSLRAELSALRIRDVRLTDAEFSSRFDGADASVQDLELALREAVRIARAVDEARANVPAAAALRAHGDVLMKLAAEHGFRAELTPLWMQGFWGQCSGFVRALRKSAADVTLELSVSLEKPHGVLLQVVPRSGALRGALEGSQPTGDAVFDDAFATKTESPARLPVLLDPELRRRLTELRRAGSVALHSHTLVVQAPVASTLPERVPALLEEMRSVIETVGQNARGPGVPYR
jgi:hypothetical protein